MKIPMEQALQIAQANLKEIRTVTEWAERMGYDDPKRFSREFRNHFGERPLRILNLIRSIRAIELLTSTDKTVYEIGFCELGIGDEKKFCQFMSYHIGYSSRKIRAKKNGEIAQLIEKLKSKI